ncbi:hypothetical protein [Streptomyces europaeiscabiei]|uniref:hypothetical protein n=1 Tax=Streptomyces europaeiscabiei TaxID=146819 RepID=UPI002E2A32B8|nr:hypothetical protein [Streptomyces europaeiscabiei]
MTEVTTMRRGRSGYRILATMIMLIALFFFGGLTIYIAIHLSTIYTVSMLLLYGAAFGILVADVAAATYGAGSTFARIVSKFISRQHGPILQASIASISTGRNLTSYFILPRLEDLIKWLFIPVSFIIVSWASGEGFLWSRMFLTLFVVEYLIYSARYQWNDLRGMGEDAEHPEASARKRLPRVDDPSQKRLMVIGSLVTALLRLIVAAVIGYKVHALQGVLIFSGITFLVASIYEFLRSISLKDFVKRSFPVRQKLTLAAIWLTVGFGYSLRFLAGSYAAKADLLSPLVKAGIAFSFCFGVMFVLLTWTLEATSYCRKVADERWESGQGLNQKPHITLLVDYLKIPEIESVDVEGFAPDEECRRRPVLRDSRNFFFWSPWNVAYWASAVCGSILAAFLTSLHDSTSLLSVTAALAVAAAAYISYPLGSGGGIGFRNAVILQTLPIMGFGAWSVYWSIQLSQGQPARDAVLIVLPWLMATATYVGFRRQSYKDLKEFPEHIADAAKGAGCGAVKIAFGAQVHGVICGRQHAQHIPPQP